MKYLCKEFNPKWCEMVGESLPYNLTTYGKVIFGINANAHVIGKEEFYIVEIITDFAEHEHWPKVDMDMYKEMMKELVEI